MNKKTLKILEFEKIINSLTDMASSEPANRHYRNTKKPRSYNCRT